MTYLSLDNVSFNKDFILGHDRKNTKITRGIFMLHFQLITNEFTSH